MIVTPVVTAEDETIDPDPEQTITPEWLFEESVDDDDNEWLVQEDDEVILKENEMTTQNHSVTEIAYTEPGKDLTLSSSLDEYFFEAGYLDDGEPTQNYDDELEYIYPTSSGYLVEADGNSGLHLLVLREGDQHDASTLPWTDHDVLPVVISEYSITTDYAPDTASPDDELLIEVTVDNPDDEIEGVEIGAEFDDEPVWTEANSLGNGTYQATIDIPEDTPEGEYSIHATALGSNEYGGFQEPLALSTVSSINIESSDSDDSDNGDDEDGDSDPSTGNDTPEVTITSPESAAVNESVLFSTNITGTDEEPEYNWTISNQTYTDSIPSHTFTEIGEHQIGLTATFEDAIVNDTAAITITDGSSSNDSDTDEDGSGPQQPDLDDDDESDDALALSPVVIVAGITGMLLILIYRTN